MKERLRGYWRALRKRLSLKVLIGGPAGICAWSLSGAGALAVVIWGLKTIALPLLMIKTVSWGIWGAGVLHQSQQRKKRLEEEGAEAKDSGAANKRS
ncbi:hypothetical protein MIT9_P2409 [Methylomarinovum caldicuralii]|uniref:Uncharacterized protein n=2 Tax=Methylomarinovum caldicuralii TaxID=438856 RepID=A0AAU9CB11_9GAMM|nr:hypothetical protein MIT9_P2409 [Methylomarinovum caldicuralii]